VCKMKGRLYKTTTTVVVIIPATQARTTMSGSRRNGRTKAECDDGRSGGTVSKRENTKRVYDYSIVVRRDARE